MDERLVKLFKILRHDYQVTGNPLCPVCDEEFIHYEGCVFADLLANPPVEAPDQGCDHTIADVKDWLSGEDTDEGTPKRA